MAIEQLKNNVTVSSQIESVDEPIDKITSKKLKELMKHRNGEYKLIEWFEYNGAKLSKISISMDQKVITISGLFNTAVIVETNNRDWLWGIFGWSGDKSSSLEPIDFQIQIGSSNERWTKFLILTKKLIARKQITKDVVYSTSGSVLDEESHVQEYPIYFHMKQQQKLNAFLDYAITIINKNPWKE